MTLRSITRSLFAVMIFAIPSAHAARGLQIFSPWPNAVIQGERLVIETNGCGVSSGIRVEVDGKLSATRAIQSPYLASAWFETTLPSYGLHQVKVITACGARSLALRSAPLSTALAHADQLAKRFMRLHPAQSLGWDWVDAIFLYGLERLRKAETPSAPVYAEYLKTYHSKWDSRGLPKIDRSDRCASALSALPLMVEGFAPAQGAVRTVADYIRTAKRYAPGVLNHLGTSPLNLIYPASAWVDSLMMYAVFATQAGESLGDHELRDFGAAQPARFAELLMNEQTSMFRHAWLFSFNRAVPAANAWLRGNGWVLVATVDILEALPLDHPERPRLLALLDRLSRAALTYQLENGAWDTLISTPGSGYAEFSGTALVAYAWLKGVRRGWLPAPLFLDPAMKAWNAISTRVTEESGAELSMHEISGPTNALPAHFYRGVKRRADLGYGVGAYLLLATEVEQVTRFTNGELTRNTRSAL